MLRLLLLTHRAAHLSYLPDRPVAEQVAHTNLPAAAADLPAVTAVTAVTVVQTAELVHRCLLLRNERRWRMEHSCTPVLGQCPRLLLLLALLLPK